MNNEYEIIIAKSKLTFDLPNWFLRFLEEYAEKMLYERLADISNSLRRTEYETRLVPFITMENLVMPYSPLTGTFFRWSCMAFFWADIDASVHVSEKDELRFRDRILELTRDNRYTTDQIDRVIESEFPATFGLTREAFTPSYMEADFYDEEVHVFLADRYNAFAMEYSLPSIRELIMKKRFVHFEVIESSVGYHLAPDVHLTHSYGKEFRTATQNSDEGGCFEWILPQLETW